MKNEKFPIVEVAFVISGEVLDLSTISMKMKMNADKQRDISEWPDVIKNSTFDSIRPLYEWVLLFKKEQCTDITIVLKEMIQKLSDKKDIINSLSNQYEITITTLVTIHANSNVLPYVGLGAEEISFLNEISSDIDFDIYVY